VGGRDQELRVSGNRVVADWREREKCKGEGGIKRADRVEVVSACLGKGVLIDSRL